jgi:hypothetical protein
MDLLAVNSTSERLIKVVAALEIELKKIMEKEKQPNQS